MPARGGHADAIAKQLAEYLDDRVEFNGDPKVNVHVAEVVQRELAVCLLGMLYREEIRPGIKQKEPTQ